MKLPVIVVLSFLAAFFAISQAQADEVILDNGNRITGTVTEMTGDTVVVSSDYAEPIKVKKGHVARISTDKSVEVHLSGGEILKGKLTTLENGQLTIDEGGGRTASGINFGEVTAINPPPVGKWHGNVSLAGNVQSGNTDRSGFSASAEATRKGIQDRFKMRFLYNISQENDKLSARDAFGALQYDYFFTKKFFGYLGVELLNDTFKDLNLRTVVGPGVGYQVWDDPVKALSLEAGIAYFNEDLRLHPDRHWFTLRLAADFRYTFAKWLVFTDKLTLYPSLASMNDFTLRNEAALLTGIGAGWSFKLAHVLDYDNDPPSGTKSTDSLLTAGLQYAF